MIEFEPQILVTNVIAVGIIIVNLIFGCAVFYKSIPRELKTAITLLSLTMVFFVFFFVLAFNVRDPELARLLFSFSSIVFVLGVLLVHLITAAFRIVRSNLKKLILGIFYFFSVSLMVAFFVLPDLFIKIDGEKTVFSERLMAGDYFFIVLIFWGTIFFTSLLLLAIAVFRAIKEENLNVKNKAIYVIISIVMAGGSGSVLVPLVYGTYSNLWLFLLSGLFIIPLTYGTTARSVVGPTSILKRALLFLMLSVAVTFFIAGIMSLNEWLTLAATDFPGWVIPAISSLFIVSFLMYFWYAYTNTEVLKYEFISVITHKFRTPLTRIKWSVQMLENSTNDEEKTMAAEEIAASAQTLVDLTDILVDASRMEGHQYQYKFSIKNLNYIVERVYEATRERIESKEINYSYVYDDSFSKIYADEQRLSFALQILFENAVNYTPQGGSVSVRISKEKDDIIFSITDTGIGISAKEQNFLFSKFYRSRRAKLTDPNGMGIGVFMAKKIIERHEGKIWATSPGPNCGSTFWVSFPNAGH